MSTLIDNIKRLAGMIRNEKKSGGNTAERVGGLFDEIADELNNKYDRTEADHLMNTHNTADASHLNIQQKLIQLIDETREALLEADQGITQDLTAHAGIKAIHKTSEEIRAEITDQDIPVTLARVSYVQTQRAEIINIAKELVTTGIAEVVGGAPDALNALNELAAAINNDPNFAASIMALINAKANLIHTHTKAQITDFPAAMPASDVYSWAKQPTKPAYSAAEVGASPSNHNHAGVYQPAGSYATGNHTHEGVYQPAGSYASANHNHSGVYQPAGSYAAATHGHNADQISDTAGKVIMTAAERSKLAGIEPCIPDVKMKVSDGYIYVYHDKLPDNLSKLDPQIVLMRSKKIFRHRNGSRPPQKRWCDIKDRTIGLASSVNGNDYFKFQLSPEKWNLLRRRSDGQAPTISALTYSFIGRRINQNGIAEHVISFCTGKWRYATIGRNFIRKGLFALAVRVNNPDYPNNGVANGVPQYLYGNLTTFDLIFSTDHGGICCTNLTLRS